jgi:hypothetical protein
MGAIVVGPQSFTTEPLELHGTKEPAAKEAEATQSASIDHVAGPESELNDSASIVQDTTTEAPESANTGQSSAVEALKSMLRTWGCRMKEFVTMSAGTNSTEPLKISPTNADNSCEQIPAEEVLTADSRNNKPFLAAAVSNPTAADDDANNHLTPTYSK